MKALFLLPALSTFAICFGFAVEGLGRRSRPLAVVLAVLLVLPRRLARVRDRVSTGRDTSSGGSCGSRSARVALIMVAVLAGWKVHDLREPTP